MSDLIARMRDWPVTAPKGDGFSSHYVSALLREGADEIEVLRAQLRIADKRASEFFDEAAAQAGKTMRAENKLTETRNAAIEECIARLSDKGWWSPTEDVRELLLPIG